MLKHHKIEGMAAETTDLAHLMNGPIRQKLRIIPKNIRSSLPQWGCICTDSHAMMSPASFHVRATNRLTFYRHCELQLQRYQMWASELTSAFKPKSPSSWERQDVAPASFHVRATRLKCCSMLQVARSFGFSVASVLWEWRPSDRSLFKASQEPELLLDHECWPQGKPSILH